MIRLALVASLLAGCRVSLESTDLGDGGSNGRACSISTTSPSCADATAHADLAWLEANIFATSCNFSGCHDGGNTSQGKVDLRPGKSRAHLVDFTSMIDPTRKLVVPNDVQASYLMLMLRDVPPAMANPPGNPPPGSVGYMPQTSGSATLCCQKLDALERWIMAGAPSM
jgi:hypothetical protein